MNSTPCWKCKKRSDGCHSECADYKIFRCEVQAIREYERKFFSSIDSMNLTHGQQVKNSNKKYKGGNQ